MACFSKESSFDASEFRVLAAMNLVPSDRVFMWFMSEVKDSFKCSLLECVFNPATEPMANNLL